MVLLCDSLREMRRPTLKAALTNSNPWRVKGHRWTSDADARYCLFEEIAVPLPITLAWSAYRIKLVCKAVEVRKSDDSDNLRHPKPVEKFSGQTGKSPPIQNVFSTCRTAVPFRQTSLWPSQSFIQWFLASFFCQNFRLLSPDQAQAADPQLSMRHRTHFFPNSKRRWS